MRIAYDIDRYVSPTGLTCALFHFAVLTLLPSSPPPHLASRNRKLEPGIGKGERGYARDDRVWGLAAQGKNQPCIYPTYASICYLYLCDNIYLYIAIYHRKEGRPTPA